MCWFTCVFSREEGQGAHDRLSSLVYWGLQRLAFFCSGELNSSRCCRLLCFAPQPGCMLVVHRSEGGSVSRATRLPFRLPSFLIRTVNFSLVVATLYCDMRVFARGAAADESRWLIRLWQKAKVC